MLPISIDDVRRAAATLDGVAHRTPLFRSRTLTETLRARDVVLKAESFQRVGAFKFRGAYNAVANLAPEQRANGVVTASSGNHAQALALAARLHGIAATILMPADAPPAKRAATEGYGAEVIAFDRYADDREALTRQLAERRKATIVHPYDNPFVMAGQGTATLELLHDAGDLDLLVVPAGGGGLLSGAATVAKALHPHIEVVGVEPEASDDIARSKRSGRRETVVVGRTIADGQQLATPGDLTWPVIDALVDDVVTVADDEIVAAIRFLVERMKLVVEPSGATAVAALLAGKIVASERRVGAIVSGGNIAPDRLSELLVGG